MLFTGSTGRCQWLLSEALSLLADVTQEHGVEGGVDAHVPVRCLKDSVDNHCNHGQHTAKQAAGRGDDTLRQGAPPQAQQYRDGSCRIQQVAQQEEADHIVVLQTAHESIPISETQHFETPSNKLVLMDLLLHTTPCCHPGHRASFV